MGLIHDWREVEGNSYIVLRRGTAEVHRGSLRACIAWIEVQLEEKAS